MINQMSQNENTERIKVLVQDDSVVKRNRSKPVELLARVYGHVEHKYQKGFTILTLGWSDGYNFVPVGFNLLSFAKKSNCYQEISEKTDHRTKVTKLVGKAFYQSRKLQSR